MSKLLAATKDTLGEADEIRAEVWEAALRRSAGHLTRASEEMGFSPQRGHALCRRHGLLELAAKLRKESGQPMRGRPRR
jgi:hypothetical protein